MAIELGKRLRRLVNNLYHDFRFGGKTLYIDTKTRSVQPKLHLGFHGIENSEYDVLELVFSHCRVGPDDVLVDVGCGPGRVLNYFLNHYPNNRMVGLEIEEKWAAKTAGRLQRYKNVEIIAGNAIENLPKDGTIFYLFNPFDETITRQFLEKVKMLAQKRPITVVYCLTKNLSVFEEDQACKIQVIKTPPNYPSAIIQVGPLDKGDDAKSLAALESQRQFN